MKKNVRGNLPLLSSLQQRETYGYKNAKYLYSGSNVKPRKLLSLLSNESYSLSGSSSQSDINERIFLGFLQDGNWLLSYSASYVAIESIEDLLNGSVKQFYLEFWLYQPNEKLVLKHKRKLFIRHALTEDQTVSLSVFQWQAHPSHIAVIGECRGEEQDNLVITYLPCPAVTSTLQTCYMCALDGTYGCLRHNMNLDFHGPIEVFSSINPDVQFKLPNHMYLNICGDTLVILSINYEKITANNLPSTHTVTGATTSRVVVYTGETTSKLSGVIISGDFEVFTMVCSTNDGRYYNPANSDCIQSSIGSECLVVRRTSLELDSFLDDIFKYLVTSTTWYNHDCMMLDYTVNYLDVCEESSTAVCEIIIKISLGINIDKCMIAEVLFTWNINTSYTEVIELIGERQTTRKSPMLRRLRKRHYSWLESRIQGDYSELIELNNIPYVKGRSLTELRSHDNSALVTL